MLKIRRSRGRLIFNMGIPIPWKDGLYIETGPYFCLAPTFKFPMDVIAAGALSGTIDGTPMNGATLNPGVIGNALYTQGTGAYVDFGTQASGCLFHPDQCTSGITFSFWIKLHAGPATSFSVFLNNGGCKSSDIGFCFAQSMNDFGFTVRLIGPTYRGRIAPLPISQWHYVTATFKNGKIKYYLNGCRAHLIYESTSSRTAPIENSYSLTIGSMDSTSTARHIHASVDHMLIWYSELTSSDIWELYLLGGNV